MIFTTLSTKLNQLLEQHPERYPIATYVLDVVHDMIDGELDERLHQARENYVGQRVILIPYLCESCHWIGLLLKFESNHQLVFAEFIDPLVPSNFNAQNLYETLSRYYPNITLHRRTSLQHRDQVKSEKLTVENLLEAAAIVQTNEIRSSRLRLSLGQSKNVPLSHSSLQTSYSDRTPVTNVEQTRFSSQRSVDARRRRQLFHSQRSSAFVEDLDQETNDISSQIKTSLQKRDINDKNELLSNMEEKRQQIEELRRRGKRNLFIKRQESLFELEELHNLVQRAEALKLDSVVGTTSTITEEVLDENINLVYEDWRSIPPCAEQTILRLFLYTSVQMYGRKILADSETEFISPSQPVIERDIECLKQQLYVEELLSSQVEKSWSSLSVCCKNRQWETALNIVKGLIKQLNPLDIHQLYRLIGKVHDAAESVRNQKIILFIGGTGTGKSTTIHFLAGSKMVQQQIHGLNHIGPQDIKNEQLKQIRTSPFSRAETRYITPVQINLRDLGSHTNQTVILCDSPGFQDTMGPEIDIANGFGIVKAIRGCQSVKPVILISYKSIGDRCNGIRELAELLGRLIPDIRDHLKSLSYIFTKFPFNERQTIYALMHDVHQQLQRNETTDENLLMLLGDIVKKVKRDPIVLDPLHDDPLDILSELIESPTITHPDEIFHYFITDRSKYILKDHASKCQLSIPLAIRRNDYQLIEYKLDQLKTFNDFLDQRDIKAIYDACIEEVSQHLSKQYERVSTKLEQQLNESDIVIDEEIRVYHSAIEYAKAATNVRRKHLNENVVGSDNYYHHLDQQVRELRAKLQGKDIDDRSVRVILNKVVSILKIFPTFKVHYDDMCQVFKEKFESIPKLFTKAVHDFQFEDCANHLEKISQAMVIFKDHIDENWMITIYEQLKVSLLNHLRQSTSSLKSIFCQENLTSTDICTLKECFQRFETAMNTYTLQEHISKTSIDEIYQTILGQINRFFALFVNRINNKLEKEENFQSLESWMNQLDLLREIPIIQYKTAQSYFVLLERLITCVHESKTNVDLLWDAFICETEEKVTVSQLLKSITHLESAKWIDKYRPGIYTDLMNSIQEQILGHVTDIQQAMMKSSLDLTNYDKVSSVYGKIGGITALNRLQTLIPEISSRIDEMKKCFEQMFDAVCILIRNEFDLDKCKEKQYREINFERGEKAFLYVEECQRIAATALIMNSQFSTIRNHLEEFFRIFSQFIHREMESSFEMIKNHLSDDQQTVINLSILLVSRLMEIKEISTKYPKILACFFCEKCFDQWQTKINNYAIDLSEELHMFLRMKNMDEFNARLFIAKCLRRVDQVLDNQPYSNLYREYQDSFFNQTKSVSVKIIEIIQNDRFEQLPLEMKILQSSNEIGAYYLKEVKQEFNRRLEQILEDTCVQAYTLRITSDKEHILALVGALRKIRDAEIHMSESINSLEQLKERKAEIHQAIDKCLTKSLEQVPEYFQHACFSNAEDLFNRIELMRSMLGTFCSETIVRRIAILKDDLDQMRQRETIEKYSTMSLTDYRLYPPKDVLAQLNLASKTHSNYHSLIKQLENIISNKFREELDEAKEEQQENADLMHFCRRYELALKQLPREMREILEVELQYFRENAEAKLEREEENFQRFFDSGNVRMMKKFLLQHQSQKENPAYRKGCEQVLKNMETIILKITECFQKLAIQDALKEVRMICAYREELGDMISGVNSIYEEAVSQMKNTFEQVYACVIHQFSSNNHHQSVSVELTAMVEENFIGLVEFIRFEHRYKTENFIVNILPNDFSDRTVQLNDQITNYFIQCQTKCLNALKQFDVQVLKESLETIESWEPFLLRLKHVYSEFDVNDILRLEQRSFVEMLKSISDRVQHIQEAILDEECFNLKTIVSENDLKHYYEQLHEEMNFLRQAHCLAQFKPFRDIIEIETKCRESMDRRVYNLLSHIENLITRLSVELPLNPRSCQEFSIYYLHLSALSNANLVVSSNQVENIEKKFFEQLQCWTEQTVVDPKALISLKRLANALPSFQLRIHRVTDEILHRYRRIAPNSFSLSDLLIQLDDESTGIGREIIAEHSIFDSYLFSLFNEKKDRQGIDYLLNELNDDQIDFTQLRMKYDEFRQIYVKILKRELKPNHTLDSLIYDTSRLNPSHIVKLAAHVSAVWTLQHAQHFFDAQGLNNQESYLVQPHPGQVLAILYLLNVDNETVQIKNQLLQIESGEGKSVIIGIIACTLAMMGFDVYCTCNSAYLSERNYSAMRFLFESLRVSHYIHYDTLSQCLQNVADGQCLEGNQIHTLISGENRPARKPKILIMDEIDEIFEEDLYTRQFKLRQHLRDPTVATLIRMIERKKDSSLNLKSIQNSSEYQACIARFHGWETLIDQAIAETLYEMKTSINSKSESVDRNLFLRIYYGTCSVTKIIRQFQHILGVSGSLSVLTERQKEFIRDVYHIERWIIIPGIFGEKQLKFRLNDDIFIERGNSYFFAIQTDISRLIEENRPVIVVFESKEKLEKFYQWIVLRRAHSSIQCLTEESTSAEKKIIIRCATAPGRVTLCTRSFGKGTDFISYSPSVMENDGIHIIQTFFSVDISEEVQIQGRTARQSDRGSYSLILLDDDLKTFDTDRMKDSWYSYLNEKRQRLVDTRCETFMQHIRQMQVKHAITEDTLTNLQSISSDALKTFLIEENKRENRFRRSRTLVLIDETRSTGLSFNKFKKSVLSALDRVAIILETNNINVDSFEIQFVVYRNCDSSADEILQYSNWGRDRNSLNVLLKSDSSEGDLGYEGIEIALRHANREHQRKAITQIILIGDVAPKTTVEISKRGNLIGEDYRRMTELEKLIIDRIPVHTFYFENRIEESFRQIAVKTGGRCERVDLNSFANVDLLTDFVAQTILRDIH